MSLSVELTAGGNVWFRRAARLLVDRQGGSVIESAPFYLKKNVKAQTTDSSGQRFNMDPTSI